MQAKSESNVKVIDVSRHQGAIDWAKVKADGAVGAFIKATEGGSLFDDTFAVNTTGAFSNGIKVGFYHYAHPELNNAIKEAAFFAKTVASKHADFPHVLDVEGAASKLGAAALTEWCVAWLNEVERLTGHLTMIYTGGSFAKSYLQKPLAKWPLWIAHYGATTPMANSTWSAWSVFQFTSSGKVAGIAGNVDVNAMERVFFNKYGGTALVPPQATAEDTIKIVVNDKLAAYGRIIEGHAYLPLRQLGEALNVTVEWNTFEKVPYVNGKLVTTFKLIEGKTYVGVRAAAELLGGSVSWDSGTKKVYLYK